MLLVDTPQDKVLGDAEKTLTGHGTACITVS